MVIPNLSCLFSPLGSLFLPFLTSDLVQGSLCSSLFFTLLFMPYSDIAQAYLFCSQLLGLLRGSICIGTGGPCGGRFIWIGGGRSTSTPASMNLLPKLCVAGARRVLGEGFPRPLPPPPYSWSFWANTCPCPTPAVASVIFTEADGSCHTTLHTSSLAGPAIEVLMGLALGGDENNVPAPAEETVTVGTTPLIII